MPKTTKLGGPSHDLPVEVVDNLTHDEVPKGLVVTGIDGELSDDQSAKVELGAAKVRPEERGEARIAREQAAVDALVDGPSTPAEGAGESRSDGVDETPTVDEAPAKRTPAAKRV